MIPLPVVSRVDCWVCGQAKPRKECERVMLSARPRREAWRCRECSS